MGIFDPCLDITGLIGRDVTSVAADYEEAVSDEPEAVRLVVAEHRAMETLLIDRSTRLAPTMARTIATGLMPAAAMLCDTLEEVDALLEATRNWVADMGGPQRHAAAVCTLRTMGETVPEARMALCLDDVTLVLDVHDETTLVVYLVMPCGSEIAIGAADIGDDGDPEVAQGQPTLVA